MSELTEIGVTINQVGNDALRMAAELFSRGNSLRESAARAVAAAGTNGYATHAASVLSAASTSCLRAAQYLSKVEAVARIYVASGTGTGATGGGALLPERVGGPVANERSDDLLTDLDVAALTDFTGQGYRELNALLHSNAPVEAGVAARAVAVSAALAKLPNVPGSFVRGTTLTPSQLDRYVAGSRLHEHAFTSSDRFEAFAGNTIFFIKGFSGKDVTPWSVHKSTENEILFDRSTRFDVLDHWVEPNGKHVVLLEEVYL